MIDVPNLDAMTDEELKEFDRVILHLAVITDAMIRGRALRLAGDIEAALSWERFADRRVKGLPEWARW